MVNKIINIFCLIVVNICFSKSLENIGDLSNPSIEDAISKYKKLSEVNPEKKEINYNLGNLNFYKGEFDKAIVHYNDALETNNKDLKSNTHFNLGNTYYNLNDYEKSLSEYKKSLILNPNNDDARYNFEFVKKIMQKSEEEQQQDSEDGEQKNQEGDDKEQQDSEDGENENQKGNEKDQQDSEDDENRDGKLKSLNDNKEFTTEEILEREEAEAILNSLKANQNNLMRRKYKPTKPIKVLKDW